MPETKRIVETDADDWWKSFEISVRGNFNLIRAFHPLAAPGASVVHVSTAAIHLEYMEGFSGYRSSKIAAYKLFQWYAYENPNISVVQFHPGLIMDTAITRPITGIIEEAGLIPDDISLPGDFAVWAASDEAKFLSGRFVWATWDVDELKATKDDVAANWDKFTMGPIP
ncbi:hypothetical protein NM208_g11110 [Fusarium decemcellulare]|uniref:Uncharacterized protein n=2 Tax=Fusarium decemcellulare TaxID=57161 RepID=A0ACC1RVH6_9HYPO|nr:hypothetical protein NM208_g11243 [Fusarium decemcellulare]KAJ3526603.1 hypothetical protein NM208_g11110 [Fusarium decemcellulare]